MFTIRPAGSEDVELVTALRMAFLCEMYPEDNDAGGTLREMTRRYVAETLPAGDFLVWLAEEDDRTLGTCGLLFFSRPPTFRNPADVQAYLLNVYTVPEERRRGVATALLQHAIDHVRTTAARRISLHASECGRRLYERLGFVRSDSEMVLSL